MCTWRSCVLCKGKRSAGVVVLVGKCRRLLSRWRQGDPSLAKGATHQDVSAHNGVRIDDDASLHEYLRGATPREVAEERPKGQCGTTRRRKGASWVHYSRRAQRACTAASAKHRRSGRNRAKHRLGVRKAGHPDNARARDERRDSPASPGHRDRTFRSRRRRNAASAAQGLPEKNVQTTRQHGHGRGREHAVPGTPPGQGCSIATAECTVRVIIGFTFAESSCLGQIRLCRPLSSSSDLSPAV